jgi:hydroxyacylglutathione hydrolase
MFFRQIYEKGLAHASYMVGCQKSGTVAVIDAKRDVDTYIEIARQENLRITHVLETHIHADFLCGSRELAELTGAEMFLSDEGGAEWAYAFEHNGLRDGHSFMAHTGAYLFSGNRHSCIVSTGDVFQR